MKKTVSLILSITMVILLMPTFALPASAATRTWTSGDCTVTLNDDGVLTVSGNGPMEDYTYNLLTGSSAPWITYIQQQQQSLQQLKINEIVIGDGVTRIGTGAFASALTNIITATSVNIPDSVTYIGANAFTRCSSLTSIDLPDSVTYIGNSAFSNCSSLTSITIPDGVKDISDSVFNGCSKLASMDLPDGITSIGTSAFSGCIRLAKITIPSNVTSIGDSAFKNCRALTDVYCFANPSALTISQTAFSSDDENPSLITFHVAANQLNSYQANFADFSTRLTFVGDLLNHVYDKQVIRDKYLKSAATCTDPAVYYYSCICGERSSETFEHGLPNGHSWSEGIVTTPPTCTTEGVTTYTCTVCGATKTEPIDIIPHTWDEGVVTREPTCVLEGIKTYTCTECSTTRTEPIETLPFPWLSGDCTVTLNYDGTLLIEGQGAMADYTNNPPPWYSYRSQIIRIIIDEGVTSIGSCAFSYCSNLGSIDMPNSIASIGEGAFSSCFSLTSFDIPNTITSINNSTFEYCVNLKSVIIPDSVTSIGDYAFDGCRSLTAINIPNSVTSIGGSAFCGCSSLRFITISDNLASIGPRVFSDCTSLTRVSIPNGITSIGYYAFGNCSSLSYVDIPNSVTYISSLAFFDCAQLLSVNCLTDPSTLKMGQYAFINSDSTVPSVLFHVSADQLAEYETNFADMTSYVTFIGDLPSHVFDQQIISDKYLKTAATCASPAIYYYCCECGQKGTETFEYGSPEEHTWDEGIITTPASCTTEGVMTYTCTECGATKTEPIATIPHTFDQIIIEEAYLKSASTCTEPAIYYYGCTCGEKGTETFEYGLPKNHQWADPITEPATPYNDGRICQLCAECGAVNEDATIIPMASDLSLSAESFVCNGEKQKPTVTVKDRTGKTISKSNYTVIYSNANSTEPGEYDVILMFKKNYTGFASLSYQITPHKVKGLKASSIKKTKVKLSWTKVDDASYYLIEQSTDGITWSETGTTAKTAKTISGLEPGTNYKFRVSALDSSRTVSGKVSSVVKVVTLTASPEITSLTSETPRTITVSWDEVAGAKSYTVYRSRDKETWTAAKAGTTDTSCTLTGLKGGTIYIKVVAVNDADKESAPSSIKETTVTYYVLNTRSKTFHINTCEVALNLSEKYREDVPSWAKSKCVSEGYKPCPNCVH